MIPFINLIEIKPENCKLHEVKRNIYLIIVIQLVFIGELQLLLLDGEILLPENDPVPVHG